MAIKSRDSFRIGNDIGWFRPRCPTVVLNPEEVSARLVHILPHWTVGTEFTLLGVVDLDAIPQEKRHLLGDDDNLIPLVEFTSIIRKSVSRWNRTGGRQGYPTCA